jgi:hypothetical protein
VLFVSESKLFENEQCLRQQEFEEVTERKGNVGGLERSNQDGSSEAGLRAEPRVTGARLLSRGTRSMSGLERSDIKIVKAVTLVML